MAFMAPKVMAAPSTIVDLQCRPGSQAGAVWLQWTAPSGGAASYDVKYNQGNTISYGYTTTYNQSWSVGASGTARQELLLGLNTGTQYSFVMRSVDGSSNYSDYSNTTTCNAPSGAYGAMDTQAPVTNITSPAMNSTVKAGEPLTISGSSIDKGGSSVQKVEVSLDGGYIWNPADILSNDNGNLIWRYIWASASAGERTIMVRAYDWMSNVELPVSIRINVSNVIAPIPVTSTTTTTPTVPTISITVSKYYFARNLALGSTGDDVMELQKFLNDNGYTVTLSGAGSKGNETKLFGPATKRAVTKYQADHNLPATGFFGPLTRALFNK